MPESNDRGHSAETSPLAASGEMKIDICRRLGDSWPELADYVQIPSHERRQFRQGFEAQAIWEWLDSRSRLRELPEALRYSCWDRPARARARCCGISLWTRPGPS